MNKEIKDTESWNQTALGPHKRLLEFVYNAPIQEVVRTIMAKEVSNVSVAKQQDYAKWARMEANKQ